MPTLRNCVLQYRCPNNWDDLTETVDQDIRFCGECQKEVHFCYTDKELTDSIRLNRCIAFFSNDEISPLEVTMGTPSMPMPPDFYINEIVGMGLEKRFLKDLEYEDLLLIWDLLQKSTPQDTSE